MVDLITIDDEQKIDIRFGDQLFTTYHFSSDLEKPVLWPVISANGHELTRGYPLKPKVGERVDHPHHLGVWLNYGDVNGLDFWNNSKAIAPERAPHYGTIRHQEITDTKTGDKSASITATASWNDHSGHSLLREVTQLEFRAQDSVRIIDRTTTLTALEDTVALTDNKEGMFAIRVTRELELPSDGKQKLWGANGEVEEIENPDNSQVRGDYLSSEGITGGKVWGTRAKWMKLSGELEGDPVALVIYDHPDNVGYPTYWHARSYGLFAANPLGQKVFSEGEKKLNFKLMPGESVTFKYRLAVFSSDPSVAEIEQMDY
ncbi:hypothetical protein CRP01_13570 [Flavilitoribacter nigricans DSM 23189 = NBRC 102662]|uniref:Methane oxygenase PmoA n=2 Tax=Flavilitoribacter TaxID=2762562 RepID=A0A2D0NC98_FLAN2|nr:hypothetical protein CRP01_13570 [Flavilitoribacter nigricans DSM 23189 = NBRC 102662]